jgi:hypothetical protein
VETAVTQLNLESIVELIIYPIVEEFAQSGASSLVMKKSPELKLFGSEGALDSIGFVSFLLAIEGKVEEVTGKTVQLMDSRALSQTRSPFSDVQGLATYLELLLSKDAA